MNIVHGIMCNEITIDTMNNLKDVSKILHYYYSLNI